ncbi:MAG: VanZ family protein [Clostridia bacterium]|nr:VanZ family protein [Clostridia bacterium]
MLKHSGLFLLAITVLFTLMIFSFSVDNAKVSSGKSSKIVDTVVKTVEKTTNKSLAELTGKTTSEARADLTKLIRKFAHYIEYTVQSAIVLLAFLLISLDKRILSTAFVGLFTAVLDEHLQTFSNGRSGNTGDVLVDFSGTLTGIVLGIFVAKMLSKFGHFLLRRKNTSASVLYY